MIEIASALIFFIGLYGVITSRNIFKSIVSISVMEVSVVSFFLSLGFNDGQAPPIGADISNAADPLPQALVITAIILGVAVTAINLTMTLTLSEQNQTINWDELE